MKYDEFSFEKRQTFFMKSFIRRLANLVDMRVAVRYTGLLTPVPPISECSLYRCSPKKQGGARLLVFIISNYNCF